MTDRTDLGARVSELQGLLNAARGQLQMKSDAHRRVVAELWSDIRELEERVKLWQRRARPDPQPLIILEANYKWSDGVRWLDPRRPEWGYWSGQGPTLTIKIPRWPRQRSRHLTLLTTGDRDGARQEANRPNHSGDGRDRRPPALHARATSSG